MSHQINPFELGKPQAVIDVSHPDDTNQIEPTEGNRVRNRTKTNKSTII